VYTPASGSDKEVDIDVGGSTTSSADLSVFVRADVHDFRAIPAQNPTTNPVTVFAVAQNGHKTRDAKVTSWSASGTTTGELHFPGGQEFDHITDTLSANGSG